MSIAITVVHVVACIFLVLVVLLQTGKGADMGAAFGGASSTVFGAAGPSTFLSKLTTAMAVVFMLTSLSLAFTTRDEGTKTLFEDEPASPVAAPAEPAEEAAAALPAGVPSEVADVEAPAPSAE